MIKHLFVAAAILSLVSQTNAADRLTERPYRTTHDLSLVPGANGDVVDLRGLEAMSWDPNCDGAAMNHRISMTIQLNDGAPIQVEDTSSTWQSADGQLYRFLSASRSTAGFLEAVEGTATRKDGSVVVNYTAPDKTLKTLPASTLFPWQHFLELQKAAAAGKAGISNSVFTGESLENDPTRNATQLLSQVATSTLDLSHAEKLRDQLPNMLWRFSTAIFAAPNDPLPLYEISGVSTPDGVIVQGIILYPDLTIALELRELQWFPAEVCH